MKLLMFDYDGVIVDSFELTKRIYLDVSDEFGLGLPDDSNFFRELFELDWRNTLKKLGIYSRENIEKIDRIYRAGLKKYESCAGIYPGMNEVLDALSKKYALAVVTNNVRDELDYRLKKFGLSKYFKAVLTEEDGKPKPEPDLLLKCMDRFNIDPKESAFIGDMDGDILAAKSAKVGKIVGVSYGYHQHHKLKEADIIVNAPEELLNLF